MKANSRHSLLIFLFFAAIYLLLQGAKPGYTVDANAVYQLTQSIVDRGEMFPQVRLKQGVFHALIFIPFYKLGDWLAANHPGSDPDGIRRRALCWLNGVLAAMACAALFLLCREMGAGLAASRNVALAAGLSTMILPYSRYEYNKIPAMLLLTLLLWSICRYRRLGQKKDFLFAGLWAGLLVGFRLEFLLLFPGLIVLGFRQKKPAVFSDLWPGILMAGGLAALVIGYQWSRWGGVAGYEGGFNPLPFEGLYGFFFSLGKSLFLYNPILLLLPLVLWGSRGSDWWGPWWLVVGPMLVFYGWWSNWWGGWAWGPRHLVPLIPLLAAPLALETGSSHGPIRCYAFWFLTMLGIFIQLLGIAVDFNDGIARLYGQGVTEEMLVYLWPFGGIANHARIVAQMPVVLLDFGVLQYFLVYASTRILAAALVGFLLAVLALLKLRVSPEDTPI